MFTFDVNGTIVHVVPLLMDRGLSAQVAASMMIGVGISTICGIIFLGSGVTEIVPLLAIICLGLGLGAEVDLIGFLVSRYFGLRAYGQIYGFIFALFALGSGTGTMALGFAYDVTGSYSAGHMFSTALIFTAATHLWRLGPYSFPAPHAPATASGFGAAT